MRRFSVAMIEPEFALNVGYVARAMANFGISELFISDPTEKVRIDLDEATKFASHGEHIVGKIEAVRSIDDLRKRFAVLIGTTAIQGRAKSNITRKTMDVVQCASAVAYNWSHNKKMKRVACIVLGRDTTGLTNEELQKCDYNLTINTGSEYNTLNVSHAAAIVFYVFCQQMRSLQRKATEDSPRVPRVERDRVVRLFEQLAQDAEFQGFKRDRLSETLNRLLNRSDPSLRELYLLMGLASKSSSKIRRLSRTMEDTTN